MLGVLLPSKGAAAHILRTDAPSGRRSDVGLSGFRSSERGSGTRRRVYPQQQERAGAGAPANPWSQRSAAAWSLLLGRSLRNLAALLARRAMLAVGWLLASVRHPRLASFQRRWFTPRRWHVALAVPTAALLAVTTVQQAVRVSRWLVKAPAWWQIEQQMKHADSYEEWNQLACEVDRLKEAAGCGSRARLPDERALRWRRERLRRLRQQGDAQGLIFALRVHLERHAGSVRDGREAEHCPQAALRPLRDYIEEVELSLAYVAECASVPLEQRLAFFRELRHGYGRTGLCLSGGASFGFYHVGVWIELLKQGLLPKVLTGSSAGSIVASSLCVRTDEELQDAVRDLDKTFDLVAEMYGRFFSYDSHYEQLKHFVTQGTLHDAGWFHERLRALYGDLTFSEAYQRTGRQGRVLNIQITAADLTRGEPSRLLNYLTAPDVLVRSGVACSCSFPLLFHSQELLAKDARGRIHKLNPPASATSDLDSLSHRRWIDGSISADLPMQGIREMFNCCFYIVSQCNPHLLPFIAARNALPFRLGHLMEEEFKHRCRQLQYVFPRSHFLSTFQQPWEGDISMVLSHGVLPFGRASFNLTQQELRKAMQEGRVATWQKLSAIQASCAIEVAIDECLRGLTAASRAQRLHEGLQLSRRPLPSWLHLPGLVGEAKDNEEEVAKEERQHGFRQGQAASLRARARRSLDKLEEAAAAASRSAVDKLGTGKGAPEGGRATSGGAPGDASVEAELGAAAPSTPVQGGYSSGRGSESASSSSSSQLADCGSARTKRQQGQAVRQDQGQVSREQEQEWRQQARTAGLEVGGAMWRDMALLGTYASAASDNALDVIAS
ncbi:hypothetical protein N2152v2_007118 [Parachlorella kessleri]